MRSVICCLLLISFVVCPSLHTRAGQQASAGGKVTGKSKAPMIDRFGDLLPPGVLARLGTVQREAAVVVSRKEVMQLSFAPDGRTLATSGPDATFRIWNLADTTNHVLCTYAFGKVELKVFFAPDGKHVFNEGPLGNLTMTEVLTGKVIRHFELPQPKQRDWVPAHSRALVTHQITPDGRTLLVFAVTNQSRQGITLADGLYEKGLLCAWDVATGKEVLTRTIASEVDTPQMPNCYSSGTGRHLDSAQLSPNGRWLALPGPCRLHHVKTGVEKALALESASGEIGPAFAFSPDSRLLVLSQRASPYDAAAKLLVCEVLTGRQVAQMEVQPSSFWVMPLTLAFSPDGRLVAAVGHFALQIWEVATGKCVLHLSEGYFQKQIPDSFPMSLPFAPDSKSLATGHINDTVLVWDLTPVQQGFTPAGPLDPTACWEDLADPSASKAFAAIGRLAAASAKALPLLRQKLAPVKVDRQWLAARLADLDSEKYAHREAAVRDLTQVADALESDLRRALEKPPSLEFRNRILGILKTLEASQIAVPPSDKLRQLRALNVLERIGSEEAKALLGELAAGATGAGLTLEAQAALLRLATKR